MSLIGLAVQVAARKSHPAGDPERSPAAGMVGGTPPHWHRASEAPREWSDMGGPIGTTGLTRGGQQPAFVIAYSLATANIALPSA